MESGIDEQPSADSAQRVTGLMPSLVEDLKRLARVPPLASPGLPSEPWFEAHDFAAGPAPAKVGNDAYPRFVAPLLGILALYACLVLFVAAGFG
ncbi:hypothetical protein [Jiangella endophytica]|uniref:hypothetical protein n=1 Tax=Jiangella endophytica TaxID=1623398 RepID=UPI000E3566D5|nr:hypothetical protein [Jiangella endophytica]